MGNDTEPGMVCGRLESKLQLLGSHLVLPSAAKQKSKPSSCTYLKAGTGELDFSMVFEMVTNEFICLQILCLFSIISVSNWLLNESLNLLSIRRQPQQSTQPWYASRFALF